MSFRQILVRLEVSSLGETIQRVIDNISTSSDGNSNTRTRFTTMESEGSMFAQMGGLATFYMLIKNSLVVLSFLFLTSCGFGSRQHTSSHQQTTLFHWLDLDQIRSLCTNNCDKTRMIDDRLVGHDWKEGAGSTNTRLVPRTPCGGSARHARRLLAWRCRSGRTRLENQECKARQSRKGNDRQRNPDNRRDKAKGLDDRSGGDINALLQPHQHAPRQAQKYREDESEQHPV